MRVPTLGQLPDGELSARLRAGLRSLARAAAEAADRLAALPAFARALVVVAAAVAFLAALTYYSADAFSHRAVDQRAAAEADSLSTLTARLATGDAFNTYLEMLRYAEDPAVRDSGTSREDRLKAMRLLLELNTNNLVSLTVADRTGAVVASTDPKITQVLDSAAYQEARTSLTPGNTDVVVPNAGQPGYIEFAVPVKDATGLTWGVLLGRADPDRLWKTTLAGGVDGSRNVIVTSTGLLAAGVPQDLLGQPWRGEPLSGGGVSTSIAGVSSICGLSPVGAGSPIDHGFSIASCLPASLVASEHDRAIGKQGWITLAGAVLAIVLAGAALYVAERRRLVLADDADDDDEVSGGAAATEAEATTEVEPASEPATLTIAADVDAVALIDGFERRNERLSEQLREDIRARMLVAASQAEEAYRRLDPESESDDGLHREAMEELEAVRDRALRAIEQEMYPAVVDLGLPNALKSLRRDLADSIDLTLELDPMADTLEEEDGRKPLAQGLRLVLYRMVLDASRALAERGAAEALVKLARADGELSLSVESALDEMAADVAASLATSRIAIEAYGGQLDIGREDERVRVQATFAA
ncbi:MAG TPA: hypothetical protein VFY79_06730 [Dehalococcoidia bacterium]|nr:hypothetical protein [Dehalococcoidia bacterium]